jgi:AmmeMemoRadiSam system protein B
MKAAWIAHLFLPVCALLAVVSAPADAEESQPGGIRHSILAGRWYPASPDALSRDIRGYLDGAGETQPEGVLKGVVVPHAGYMYSGAVAAHAYRLLDKRTVRRVILIGPSHRFGFKGVSVNLQSAYETPLGVVPVDLETVRKLVGAAPGVRWVPQAHAAEHSLEIQLPFLQTVLGRFQIVPVIMGQQDLGTCRALAEVLWKIAGGLDGTLLLASTDLSHYHPAAEAEALDSRFIEHVRGLDPEGLSRDLGSGVCEACGGGPVVTLLLAARAMGADRVRILSHEDSGMVTGDRHSVVGYLAAAVFKSSGKDPHPR